jgi:L-lysine exporter family protein LysE/ArgO
VLYTLSITFIKGFATMAGLIIAIGVQNAFVLKQGLKHQATFVVATICFLCDALLVSLGTAGLGSLFAASHIISLTIAFGGAGFLTFYGLRSLHAAKEAKGLDLNVTKRSSLTSVILTGFAVSLLNPHAIIDTVVLVGGLAAHYDGMARYTCAIGAITASAIWFYGIGFGATWLAPFLTKPKIWRVIDLMIGVMMLVLAMSLLNDGLQLL